jgi:hypothetical protein
MKRQTIGNDRTQSQGPVLQKVDGSRLPTS